MADTFGFAQFSELFDIDSMVDESLTNTCTLFGESKVDTLPDFNLMCDEDNCISSIVQVQKTQDKSPFHESDSGVSEVSGFCGNSPGRESGIMLDEMLDNMGSRSFLVENDMTDQDLSLMKFLENDAPLPPLDSAVNIPNVDNLNNRVQPKCGRKTKPTSTKSSTSAVSNPSWQKIEEAVENTYSKSIEETVENTSSICRPSRRVTPKVAVRNRRSFNRISAVERSYSECSPSDEDEVDVTFCAPVEVAESPSPKSRGSVKVARRGSTLPSASSNPKCQVTSLKILRVVNQGKDSTPEEDIAMAIGERNRKNAELAKLNRQKKRTYIENLEKDVDDGKIRMDELQAKLINVEEERDASRREVEYLKAVLANQSALAGLLKNIPNVSSVTLSSSMSSKRVAELDHSYNSPKRSRSSDSSQPSTAGVCLHVDKNNVSLEFCHHCAHAAASSKS